MNESHTDDELSLPDSLSECSGESLITDGVTIDDDEHGPDLNARLIALNNAESLQDSAMKPEGRTIVVTGDSSHRRRGGSSSEGSQSSGVSGTSSLTAGRMGAAMPALSATVRMNDHDFIEGTTEEALSTDEERQSEEKDAEDSEEEAQSEEEGGIEQSSNEGLLSALSSQRSLPELTPLSSTTRSWGPPSSQLDEFQTTLGSLSTRSLTTGGSTSYFANSSGVKPATHCYGLNLGLNPSSHTPGRVGSAREHFKLDPTVLDKSSHEYRKRKSIFGTSTSKSAKTSGTSDKSSSTDTLMPLVSKGSSTADLAALTGSSGTGSTKKSRKAKKGGGSAKKKSGKSSNYEAKQTYLRNKCKERELERRMFGGSADSGSTKIKERLRAKLEKKNASMEGSQKSNSGAVMAAHDYGLNGIRLDTPDKWTAQHARIGHHSFMSPLMVPNHGALYSHHAPLIHSPPVGSGAYMTTCSTATTTALAAKSSSNQFRNGKSLAKKSKRKGGSGGGRKSAKSGGSKKSGKGRKKKGASSKGSKSKKGLPKLGTMKSESSSSTATNTTKEDSEHVSSSFQVAPVIPTMMSDTQSSGAEAIELKQFDLDIESGIDSARLPSKLSDDDVEIPITEYPYSRLDSDQSDDAEPAADTSVTEKVIDSEVEMLEHLTKDRDAMMKHDDEEDEEDEEEDEDDSAVFRDIAGHTTATRLRNSRKPFSILLGPGTMDRKSATVRGGSMTSASASVIPSQPAKKESVGIFEPVTSDWDDDTPDPERDAHNARLARNNEKDELNKVQNFFLKSQPLIKQQPTQQSRPYSTDDTAKSEDDESSLDGPGYKPASRILVERRKARAAAAAALGGSINEMPDNQESTTLGSSKMAGTSSTDSVTPTTVSVTAALTFPDASKTAMVKSEDSSVDSVSDKTEAAKEAAREAEKDLLAELSKRKQKKKKKKKRQKQKQQAKAKDNRGNQHSQSKKRKVEESSEKKKKSAVSKEDRPQTKSKKPSKVEVTTSLISAVKLDSPPVLQSKKSMESFVSSELSSKEKAVSINGDSLESMLSDDVMADVEDNDDDQHTREDEREKEEEKATAPKKSEKGGKSKSKGKSSPTKSKKNAKKESGSESTTSLVRTASMETAGSGQSSSEVSSATTASPQKKQQSTAKRKKKKKSKDSGRNRNADHHSVSAPAKRKAFPQSSFTMDSSSSSTGLSHRALPPRHRRHQSDSVPPSSLHASSISDAALLLPARRSGAKPKSIALRTSGKVSASHSDSWLRGARRSAKGPMGWKDRSRPLSFSAALTSSNSMMDLTSPAGSAGTDRSDSSAARKSELADSSLGTLNAVPSAVAAGSQNDDSGDRPSKPPLFMKQQVSPQRTVTPPPPPIADPSSSSADGIAVPQFEDSGTQTGMSPVKISDTVVAVQPAASVVPNESSVTYSIDNLRSFISSAQIRQQPANNDTPLRTAPVLDVSSFEHQSSLMKSNQSVSTEMSEEEAKEVAVNSDAAVGDTGDSENDAANGQSDLTSEEKEEMLLDDHFDNTSKISDLSEDESKGCWIQIDSLSERDYPACLWNLNLKSRLVVPPDCSLDKLKAAMI